MKTTRKTAEKQLNVDLLVPPSAEFGYAGIVVIGWEGEEPTLFDLEPQPSDWGLSYRLTKHAHARRGDGDDAYDLLFEPDGVCSCDCRGFTRWGHCKHVSALLRLGAEGRLPLPQLPPHGHDDGPGEPAHEAASYKPGHSSDLPF